MISSRCRFLWCKCSHYDEFMLRGGGENTALATAPHLWVESHVPHFLAGGLGQVTETLSASVSTSVRYG